MTTKLSGVPGGVINSLSKIVNDNSLPSMKPILERKYSLWLDGKYNEDFTIFTPKGTNYQVHYDTLISSNGKCFFDVRNYHNWQSYQITDDKSTFK